MTMFDGRTIIKRVVCMSNCISFTIFVTHVENEVFMTDFAESKGYLEFSHLA